MSRVPALRWLGDRLSDITCWLAEYRRMAPKESAVSEELREAELAAHDATIATHRAARLQEMANGDA